MKPIRTIGERGLKNKPMENKYPDEVWYASAILYSGMPVGRHIYDKVMEIINKYPQCFPEEHIYNNLPKEVHESYQNELNPNRKKEIDEMFKNIECGEGLSGEINKKENMYAPTELPDIGRIIQDMMDSARIRRKKEIEEDCRVRKIWNKHYKKYGLEYRSKLTKYGHYGG